MDTNENYELDLNPEEIFELADAEEVENFVVGFDEPDDLEVEFGDVQRNNEADFNKLYNRPSYDGTVMTNNTHIPKVITYQAGDDIEIENGTIIAIVDDKLSVSSTHPAQNSVITKAINEKANTNDLATVAFTGEYGDLENEPRDFTEEEWNTLWADY